MSHFQPCEKRLRPSGVLRGGVAAFFGLTLVAAIPVQAQKVQTFEPEVSRTPAAQHPRSIGNDTVRTPAQNAALQRDFDLLLAAYNGETHNVRAQLAKGATIEVRDAQYGFTPLMYAAANGHLGTVRYLISKGAKVNTRSREGVQIALATGESISSRTVEQQGQLMQMNRVPVLLSESGGVTPLMLASGGGYNLTVRELLSHGADPNYRSPDGDTALMYAAFKGYLPSVQALLARGARVDDKDRYGQTALMQAAWLGHLPVVRLLLNKGAQANIKARNGWTPINYAQALGHTMVVRVLRQAAARQAKAPPPSRSTPVPAKPVTNSPTPSDGSLDNGSIIILR